MSLSLIHIWTLDATAEDAVVAVRSMPETLNLLEVTEGRLPQAAGECVTESMLLTKLDLAVGDTLELALDVYKRQPLCCVQLRTV